MRWWPESQHFIGRESQMRPSYYFTLDIPKSKWLPWNVLGDKKLEKFDFR
jgi:hypothetical protein